MTFKTIKYSFIFYRKKNLLYNCFNNYFLYSQSLPSSFVTNYAAVTVFYK